MANFSTNSLIFDYTEESYRAAVADISDKSNSRVVLAKSAEGSVAYMVNQSLPLYVKGLSIEKDFEYGHAEDYPLLLDALPKDWRELNAQRARLGKYYEDYVIQREGNRDMALMLVPTTICGMSCCPAGSMVRLADGTEKPVEDILKGDLVVGYQHNGLKSRCRWTYSPSEVLDTFSRVAPVFEYLMDDGTSVKSTDNHFWFSGGRYLDGDKQSRDGQGFCNYINPKQGKDLVKFPVPSYKVSKSSSDFKMGYVRGALDGEGHRFKSGYTRFMVNNREFFDRVLSYASEFVKISYLRNWVFDGEKIAIKPFDPNFSAAVSGEGYVLAINAANIKSIRAFSTAESTDYLAGWLSGIIDAEGSYAQFLSIAQYVHHNPETYANIAWTLDTFSIKYSANAERFALTNSESMLRTYCVTDCAIKMKTDGCLLQHVKKAGATRKIVAVKPLGEQRVYSFKTSTGNYISQGYLSRNCGYCYAGDHSGNYEKVSLDFDALERWFGKHGHKIGMVIVYGGDSLMLDDLPQLLRRISKPNCTINFVTGMGYAPVVFKKKIERAMQAGVTFTFSIDCPPEEGHAYTRVFKLYPGDQYKQWYDELISRMEWFENEYKTGGFSWGARPSISEGCYDWRRLRNDLKSATGLADVTINMEPATTETASFSQPVLEKIHALMKLDVEDIAAGRIKPNSNQYLRDKFLSIINPHQHFTTGGCYEYLNRISLGPRGEITFCNEVPTYDPDKRHLWDFGTKDEMDASKYAKVMMKMANRPEACRQCDHRNTCGTHCPTKLFNNELGGCMFARMVGENILRAAALLGNPQIWSETLSIRVKNIRRWQSLPIMTSEHYEDYSKWLMR